MPFQHKLKFLIKLLRRSIITQRLLSTNFGIKCCYCNEEQVREDDDDVLMVRQIQEILNTQKFTDASHECIHLSVCSLNIPPSLGGDYGRNFYKR